MNVDVELTETDPEILACYPVMRELRPHIGRDEFLARIRRQERAGYRLAFIRGPAGVVAVAGFRLGESLAWGRYLYIDDLVTSPAHRSGGYGAKLLDWLRAYAVRRGCDQLHLDSGFQRSGAHRFYERAGLSKTSYHFVEELPPSKS